MELFSFLPCPPFDSFLDRVMTSHTFATVCVDFDLNKVRKDGWRSYWLKFERKKEKKPDPFLSPAIGCVVNLRGLVSHAPPHHDSLVLSFTHCPWDATKSWLPDREMSLISIRLRKLSLTWQGPLLPFLEQILNFTSYSHIKSQAKTRYIFEWECLPLPRNRYVVLERGIAN